MKKIFSLLLAVIMVLSLAACGGGADKGSTLVYGSGDYDTINPIMNEHCEIKHLLFDSLVKLDKNGDSVASLAESWSYDEATMTYTFKLRSDVKWHDGEKFTADDVKFTIEAIMNPDNSSENYPNYIEVKEITVISDTEVAFVLSEPNFTFLDYMTMSILPEHKLQGEDMWESDYFKNPIGTGPYKLESWDASQAITMVKNEDYFAGAAKIDTIIFKIVTDDSGKRDGPSLRQQEKQIACPCLKVFMLKILFICHGNICRSPMAESVMTHLVQEAGKDGLFEISSAATSREEIGNPVHHGTVKKLRQVGVPLVPHRAVQMTKADYKKYDLIIGMDQWNLRNMNRILGGDPDGKVHLLLDFTDRKGDIADPWYTGDFDETYRDVLEGCQGLFEYCMKNLYL